MNNTGRCMCKHKPCERMTVVTASNQLLPVLGIGKHYFAIKPDNLTGLFLNEVLHLPQLTENLLSLRIIVKAGLDFVSKNVVLYIGHRRIRLTPKDNLYACEAYLLPRSFQWRPVVDPLSKCGAAKAMIAPGSLDLLKRMSMFSMTHPLIRTRDY